MAGNSDFLLLPLLDFGAGVYEDSWSSIWEVLEAMLPRPPLLPLPLPLPPLEATLFLSAPVITLVRVALL